MLLLNRRCVCLRRFAPPCRPPTHPPMPLPPPPMQARVAQLPKSALKSRLSKHSDVPLELILNVKVLIESRNGLGDDY
jgi:hypothetical protein